MYLHRVPGRSAVKLALTGATGSLGGALIARLRGDDLASRLVAISRDEVKSGDLAERYADYRPLKAVLGDVRDVDRMAEIFRGCDTVVHAGALKRISHSVYSPEEMVKTNVQGTINVIKAATEIGVRRVVVISSDKCSSPINLYGATKFVAETYAVQANSYAFPRGTTIAAVRYGNVLGSRGSVVHVWREALDRGEPLRITHAQMSRFIITLPQATAFVLRALALMEGGEVFVPLLPAARIDVLADAIEAEWLERHGAAGYGTDRARIVTGLRPGGEKLAEALLSDEEAARTWHCADGGGVVILPSHHSWRASFEPPTDRGVVGAYNSDRPVRWLERDELVKMLREVP